MSNEIIEITALYGVLKPSFTDIAGVSPAIMGLGASRPKCDYCGLLSSGGVVKCLNCGAPK